MTPSRLASSAAVLLVKDIVAASAYYRDKLGFAFDELFGDPPSYCILHRDGCSLMLKQADDPRHVVPHWTVSDKLCNVYFWVTDADSLCAEFRSRGATIDYGPCDQPYGCREFGIQDVDGYDISFGQTTLPSSSA
jgi:predicted enzyme related to lactoylglutathione lyase